MKTALILLLLLLTPAIAYAECVETPRSSWISQICWNGKTVTVTMKGSPYTFCGISRSLFDEWVSAPSVGTFYNQRIKDR